MSQRTPWLKTNLRPLSMSMVFPCTLMVVGGLVVLFAPASGWWNLLRYLSLAALTFAVVAIGSLTYLMRVPRLAYEQGYLLVYGDYLIPHRVPIDVVEFFFMGQGPSKMPWTDDDDGPETSNLVVRLAEAEKDWHQKSCRPQIGHWCDGYITLRGTWCEPLHRELIGNLNRLLVAAHREVREETAEQ